MTSKLFVLFIYSYTSVRARSKVTYLELQSELMLGQLKATPYKHSACSLLER
jgi:hypothetical protein